MRLSRATFADLPPGVRPARAVTPKTGIVHFGPGAFHRAHQAAYIDALLDRDPRWGIAAISLRSADTVAALAEQDGLYALAIRDAVPSIRVLDAHTRYLGPADTAALATLLANPAVGLVTATVTEKGYCLAANGTLDRNHPDIVHDLCGGVPRSVIGWIVAGLESRRRLGTPPFVPLPCDNLAENGRKLHAALIDFARARDGSLADWIAGEVRVPCTMVDSITPASDDVLRANVAAAIGMADQACVQREAFTQWVIEDVGPIGPDLASVGAVVTAEVAAYEQAKLRILNGAHSTLAYAGLLRGASTVAEAMRDEALAAFVNRLIVEDIAPTLCAPATLDLDCYRRDVLTRFRNPQIVHRLDQIAQDGSQKLPYRLGDTIDAHRRDGRMPGRAVAAFGCWIAFLMRRSRSGQAIVDPTGATLTTLASEGTAANVTAWLIEADLAGMGHWQADADLVSALATAADRAFAGNCDFLQADT